MDFPVNIHKSLAERKALYNYRASAADYVHNMRAKYFSKQKGDTIIVHGISFAHYVDSADWYFCNVGHIRITQYDGHKECECCFIAPQLYSAFRSYESNEKIIEVALNFLYRHC